MSGTCADALPPLPYLPSTGSRRRSRRPANTERVTLFVAYDDIGILRAQAAQIPMPSVRQHRAEEVLRALIALYLDSLASPTFRPALTFAERLSRRSRTAVIDAMPRSPTAIAPAFSPKTHRRLSHPNPLRQYPRHPESKNPGRRQTAGNSGRPCRPLQLLRRLRRQPTRLRNCINPIAVRAAISPPLASTF